MYKLKVNKGIIVIYNNSLRKLIRFGTITQGWMNLDFMCSCVIVNNPTHINSSVLIQQPIDYNYIEDMHFKTAHRLDQHQSKMLFTVNYEIMQPMKQKKV